MKPRIQIKFGVVAMTALVSMTAFPQVSEDAIEVTSSVAEIAVGNTQQTNDENYRSTNFSENTDFQILLKTVTNLEAGIQTRFNEIRSKLLDERASYINRWLDVITIVLAIFAVVIAIAGFMGFRRFREIEKEAKSSAETAAAAKDTADHHRQEIEHHLQDIRKKSETATDILKGMQAESAADNPTEATRTIANIRDNPNASLVDKAIADAVSLQQQGKHEDAIEKWRAIAQISEESDDELAARAWFSIAYLSPDEDVANKLSFYNRVIQLKPNFFGAYVNRGITKAATGRHEDAIEDFDKAIQLNPDMAEAYSNRGNSKAELGREVAAIEDFDKAIQLNSDMAEPYSNRGIVKRRLGRHESAIEDFDKAIQLNPDMAEAYSNRGTSNAILRRHESAIEDFDKAIQLNPDMALSLLQPWYFKI